MQKPSPNSLRSLLLIGLCVLTIGSSLFSQEPADPNATQKVSSQGNSASPASSGDIRIAGGDLIEVKVFGVADLSGDIRVNNSGDISMPLIGMIHVDGLTTSQAQDLIQARLKDGGFMVDPHVSVFTKEYATQGVSILGEVQKPGVYPILGQRRLFDALSIAGGTTQRAGKMITITHRDAPDKPVSVELSNTPDGNAAANVEVRPGDTIMVGKAGVVYVVGDVTKPSGFVMDNNEHMTVLQALAMAGGANVTASLDSARIIRKSNSGLQEIPIPLGSIMSAKKEDQSLQADDVLFVPRSAGKSVARRSAEAVLQMTTGVIIYRR